jgi:hypothetical protein
MSVSQFFDQIQQLENYEAKLMQTLPAESETFTVEFHVDSRSSCLENLDYKITASQHDPNAVCIIVEEVDEVLLCGLRDDDLAEFFGIESEDLIYTNRPKL